VMLPKVRHPLGANRSADRLLDAARLGCGPKFSLLTSPCVSGIRSAPTRTRRDTATYTIVTEPRRDSNSNALLGVKVMAVKSAHGWLDPDFDTDRDPVHIQRVIPRP